MMFRAAKTVVPALVLGMLLAAEGVAADKVKLPDTAKLLTKAEVIALYGGKKTEWDHPNTDGSSGTAEFDATLSTAQGTYTYKKKKGTWVSRLSFKNDLYCYEVKADGAKKFGKRTCNAIYVDGDAIYEVDPKSKKVLSLNKIVP